MIAGMVRLAESRLPPATPPLPRPPPAHCLDLLSPGSVWKLNVLNRFVGWGVMFWGHLPGQFA